MKGSDLFSNPERANKFHRGMIVGLDPGLTVGIAILDLKGNLISLSSFKEIRRSEIISHIITYGKTVLVATDVYPPPKTVRKLASILNSKISSPYRSMSVEAKIEIVDSFLQGIDNNTPLEVPQNAHERDALAAAVKTYRDNTNKFRQIMKRALNAELNDNEIDKVKTLVINGVSISNAIKHVSENVFKENSILTGSNSILNDIDLSAPDKKSSKIENDTGIISIKNSIDEQTNTISRLKHKIKSQKRYINNLKQKNLFLEENNNFNKTKISKLQSKIDKLHYNYSKKILQEKEIKSKITTIQRLQKEYNDEKIRRIELEEQLRSNDLTSYNLSENVLPVKIIEFFTKDGIREACDKWKIKRDDIILLKNSEGGGSQTASMIIKMGVKAVIIIDKISDPAENIFEENMIPVIPAGSVEMTSMSEFSIVNKKALDSEIVRWKEKVNNLNKIEHEKKLIKLLDEYRAQRRRS
jgi:predicted RNase H-like nuclease (RuvC/YqgF family)